MENLIKCDRCKKELISEEYQNHICSPYFLGVKEISVDYSFETKDEKGNSIIIAKGLDGILYRLKKSLSTESKHDKHYRQGNTTCFMELLPCRLIL